MNERICPATRSELPPNLHWGDRINVQIIQVAVFGVFFKYNNLLGFIDVIRLTRNEYHDFQNGIIKPGDNYETGIGIIEDLSLTYPNHGTFLLLARNDKIEINQEYQYMASFCSQFNIGDSFFGRISNTSVLGFYINRVNEYGEDKNNDPRIIGYYSNAEVQYNLAKEMRMNHTIIQVKINEFDNQVLRVVVETVWDTVVQSDIST